jgi:beta-phosphoglucomutase
MNRKGFIFDLDGVIVDTAKYHFKAWSNLAKSLGIHFSEVENEQLKGVSRIESLKKILDWGGKRIDEVEFQKLMGLKNTEYLSYISSMSAREILPGVLPVLDYLKKNQIPVALGSASKNAKTILDKVGLNPYFQAVVDGNEVAEAKPNPEVFLKAAQLISCEPENCIVFEDSLAGIIAANTAGMYSVGIVDSGVLEPANKVFRSFEEIEIPFIESLLKAKR